MPELINQQRTLLVPGQGIVNPAPPTKEFHEYPKVMRHAGETPAVIGAKVKFGDPDGPGFVHYQGGTPGRYLAVLVHGPQDEEYHRSQGYDVVAVKVSEDAFRRMVREDTVRLENHVAIEYPKWVNGKLVSSAAEEAALTGAVAQSPVVAQPTASVPAPVSTDDEIAALEARITALKEGKARVARLKAELAALEAGAEEQPIAPEPEATEEEMEAYAAKRNPPPISAEATAAEITEAVAAEAAQADPLAEEIAAKKKVKSDAIKAGLARRKAEKAKPAA